jgi:hypothetical protein
VRKITEWNLIGKRSKGHPKNRRKDEVLNDLKKLKVKNCTYLFKDRKAWYELVKITKTHKGLEEMEYIKMTSQKLMSKVWSGFIWPTTETNRMFL